MCNLDGCRILTASTVEDTNSWLSCNCVLNSYPHPLRFHNSKKRFQQSSKALVSLPKFLAARLIHTVVFRPWQQVISLALEPNVIWSQKHCPKEPVDYNGCYRGRYKPKHCPIEPVDNANGSANHWNCICCPTWRHGKSCIVFCERMIVLQIITLFYADELEPKTKRLQ